MPVQARFYVAKTTQHAYNPTQSEVTLQAVTRGKVNAEWAAATPSGQITMFVNNPAAAAWFTGRLGKEVAITFDDRPEVCPECEREIEHTPGVGSYGPDAVPDGRGVLFHKDCLKKVQASRG